MLLMLFALLMQAPSEGPVLESREITEPDWRRGPGGRQIGAYYPEKAAERELPGRAGIKCTVDPLGELNDCKVVEEFPAGLGFGAAALRMSKSYVMRPLGRDGQPVGGGFVRIPIQFSIGDRTDALSAMYVCQGVAAIALERAPQDPSARRMREFFELQVRATAHRGLSAPDQILAGLADGRRTAAADAKGGWGRTCSELASETVK